MLCLVTMVALVSTAHAGKPNVLLIVADDLGVNDVSYLGGAIATPNIDTLAKQSVRFRRHYADSTCAPARAALLTGSFPARVGITPAARGISPSTATLPRTLGAAGYRTVHIGKWHIGHSPSAARPLGTGFARSLVFYTQWLLSGKLDRSGEPLPSTPRYHNPFLITDDTTGEHYPGHLTDILTDHAIKTIGQAGGESPWFINLWYNAPHDPVQPSRKFVEVDSPAGKYTALVRQLDYNIGRVIEHLRTTKQLDDTIVIFASDNGGTNKYTNSNAPFNGRKRSFREGGLRTPMFIHYPKALAPTDTTTIASIMDIYPTLAGMLNLSVPETVDGVDLFAEEVKPRNLYWELSSDRLFVFSALSSDGRWRLIEHKREAFPANTELFDLETEPSSETNVLEAHPEKAAALKALHGEWHKRIRRLPVTKHLSKTGHGYVEDDDMLRSPGYGQWSFSIAVTGAATATPSPSPIAVQGALWDITYDHNQGKLNVHALDWRRTFPLHLTNGCHSVTISGDFMHRRSNWQGDKDRAVISVFVDGALLERDEIKSKADGSDRIHVRTQIGQTPGSREKFPGRLSEPILTNIVVGETTILNTRDIHTTLCAQLAAAE